MTLPVSVVGAGPQRWDMTATPAKPHKFGGAGTDR